MKIIFLDVDGVLNSSDWNHSNKDKVKNGFLIDETKVALLGKLIENTNAKIVLHSGWRFWFDNNFKPVKKESEYFNELLLKCSISFYDFTPDFSTEEIRRTKEFSLVKADEILSWLKEHREVSGWVVIDDLDLHNSIISAHQVKPDSACGLSVENIRKAEKILLQ